MDNECNVYQSDSIKKKSPLPTYLISISSGLLIGFMIPHLAKAPSWLTFTSTIIGAAGGLYVGMLFDGMTFTTK